MDDKIPKKGVHHNFLDDKVSKESVYHTCIAFPSNDSVMKKEKKNYPQVNLEECKYKIRKIKMPGLINIKLGSDSSSDFEWL